MIKKCLIIILILIFAIGIVSAQENSTDTGDELPLESPDDAVKGIDEIQTSINEANDKDTVKLNGTYKNGYSSQITVNKSLTIDGQGNTVIDGNNHRVSIDVKSEPVTLQNLKFVNITEENIFSHVIINTGVLNLINCSFENIKSEGLIMNYNRINIENCEFKNAEITYDVFANARNSDDGQTFFILKNSIIFNNTAQKIFDIREVKTLTVTNNIISNNNITEKLLYYLDNRRQQVAKKSQIQYNQVTFSNNILIDTEIPKFYLMAPIAEVNDGPDNLATKFTFDDNFFGFNLKSNLEFSVLEIFEFEYSFSNWWESITWSNLDLKQVKNEGGNYTYELYFQNSKGQPVTLNNWTFSIQNKSSKDVLLSDIGIGTFNFNKDINMSNVYILNSMNNKVNKDPAKITYRITGNNFENIKVEIILENNGMPLSNQKIRFDIDAVYDNYIQNNHYSTNTDANGHAVCDGSAGDGSYYIYGFFYEDAKYFNIITTFSSYEFGCTQETYSHLVLDRVPLVAEIKDITTTYGSKDNVKFSLLYQDTKKGVDAIDACVRIYKGSKIIKEYYPISSKGTCTFKLPKLDAGSYKIMITDSSLAYKIATKTVKLTVNKIKTTVKAPKVTFKHKKSKYFQATVKANKKPVKKIVLKVKIGKNTYKVKTNSKGVAKFNTKKLNVGKHKVVISSGNNNYQISAKSQITIKR
jgi:hypothetical protein